MLANAELLAGVCGLEKLNSSTLYATPAYPPGSGPEFVNAAVRVECRLSPDQLLAALDDLEQDEREVLALRHFEHLSNAEAAAVLEMNVKSFSTSREVPLPIVTHSCRHSLEEVVPRFVSRLLWYC